ncbi:hypothetical protein OROGR_030155 [Orobanche gracilis]
MVGRRKNEKWIWRIKDQSKASSSSPPQPSVPWIDLPLDVTANILQRLGAAEILDNAYKVCTTWRSVCQNPSMWRKIKMTYSPFARFDFDIICQCAVDRSQGQLVDLNICGFGCDELLFYIAQRVSSHLVCLTLDYAGNLTGRGLAEATERFPLLEVLHVSFFSVSGEFIEQVGHSCPLLKSFTLNKAITNIREPECDTEALAIAKTMSGLRHLSLFGNLLSNRGLVAILDGCEHLESLNLQRCYGVDLTGDLGKRCSLRLKSLTKPDEFTVDYRPAGR